MTTRMQSVPFLRRVRAFFIPGMLDRYLILQVMPPFLVALSVVMSALLLERLLVLFNLLAAGNNHIATFLGLLGTLLPHYLGLAIPAALCTSVFTVMRRMSQNEEIDAINSSGISLTRVARPYILLGLLLGAMSFFLYGFIQPLARYDFREALYVASHTGWAPRLQSRTFARPSDTLTLVADHVDQGGSHLTDVFIRDTSEGHDRTITAVHGQIRVAADGSSVEIDLQDGTILTETPNQTPTLTSFDTATRYLTKADHLAPFRERGDDERELTSPELISRLIRHDPRIPFSHMLSELHFRLARCLTIPFIPVLAVALAIMRKRQGGNSGLIVAFLALVGFDHLLQFGHSMVATKNASLLNIWLPAVIFAVGCSVLLFYKSGALQAFKAHYNRKRRTIKAGQKA
ncbi:LptF/LptG family permease [Acetobacter orientalis]|uniref:LptF/LptG family permease n=1 Tax=Acetobacter orientalis TaxID=146474 RepID=UPI00241FA13E|nr:LptF/LptG family permease [Acetobacter orientalis]